MHSILQQENHPAADGSTFSNRGLEKKYVPKRHCLCLIMFLVSGLLFWLIQTEEGDLPGVENVVARQFLGSSDHFLTAYDTNIVGGLQVFWSGIRVSEQRQKQNGT